MNNEEMNHSEIEFEREDLSAGGILAFLVLWVWMSLVTVLNFSDPDPTPNVVLRLFAPFALVTSTGSSLCSSRQSASYWRRTRKITGMR